MKALLLTFVTLLFAGCVTTDLQTTQALNARLEAIEKAIEEKKGENPNPHRKEFIQSVPKPLLDPLKIRKGQTLTSAQREHLLLLLLMEYFEQTNR